MKSYTVSLTLSVEAASKEEARDKFDERVRYGDYDIDSVETEEEKE